MRARLYYSGNEWGVFILGPAPRLSFYWNDNEFPSPQQRADRLRELGFEVVSAWAWSEPQTHIPTVNMLMGIAHVRPLAERSDDEILRAAAPEVWERVW